jgi:hypothetical protein
MNILRRRLELLMRNSMENLRPFEDVSNWEEQLWLHSGGTRNKKILSDPNGILYFFKESFNNNDGKFYKYEFYSEVIASFLGKMIGLNVLNYTIAVFNERIGCLSRNMLDENEELIEGGKYLKGYNPDFIVDKENPKSKYDYHLIDETLKKYFNPSEIDKIHELIIFDAIIGNSDRHQENWGYIATHNFVTKAISEIEKVYEDPDSKNTFEKIVGYFSKKKLDIKDINAAKLDLIRNIKISPIYDSGCSLGREIEETKVSLLLKNDEMLMAYINRGKSEIHWKGRKLSHFDLLNKIIEIDPTIKNTVQKLVNRINFDALKKYVFELDQSIPDSFKEYKISNERKELIVNIITLRIQKISKIVSE